MKLCLQGFSMFTVDPLPELPVCKVVRFNIEYNILYFEEKMPENFTLNELELFHQGRYTSTARLIDILKFVIVVVVVTLWSSEQREPAPIRHRCWNVFQYFFYELLELWDWSVDGRFYFMPRFVRDLSENGKEILSMNCVLQHLLASYTPLIEQLDLVPMTQVYVAIILYR